MGPPESDKSYSTGLAPPSGTEEFQNGKDAAVLVR
jgi:hypothetical protein